MQEAIAYYRNLPPDTQDYILVERLAPVKAGELSPVGMALLKNLAAVESHNRVWAIAPLFRYALVVCQARSHNYAEALKLSEGLNLTEMPASILGSYYRNDSWFSSYNRQAEIQIEMQQMLTEQRQRWQQLQQLQAENTPESRYQLASNWAGAGGWKNGYLAVWDQWRTGFLPTGSWGNEYCERFWVCNFNLRQVDAVQNSYRQASQNAIALSLYQDLLNDPTTPSNLREKNALHGRLNAPMAMGKSPPRRNVANSSCSRNERRSPLPKLYADC